jgi:hypothetical protein
MLSDTDFDTIVNHLKQIPEYTDTSKRKECWRTADELLSQLPPDRHLGSAKELDEALCRRFDTNKDCPIRFAYYPDADTCKRLWGHVRNVGGGPGRDKLLVKLQMKPLPIEPDDLGDEVPTIFLSHALGDHHFAARVRLSLARHGIRSWLAEGDIHEARDTQQERENPNLFEAVEASLHRCSALIMLVSSISVNSAWIYTETESARRLEKPVLALIDASDVPFCKFFQRWELQKKTPWLDSNEGIQSISEVLERYMQVAPPKSRVLKFRRALEYTLDSLIMRSTAFYPDVPLEYKDMTLWKGFEDALGGLGIPKP